MYKRGKYENNETAINFIVGGIHKFYKHHLANFQPRGMLLSYCGALHDSLVAWYESIVGSTSD